MGRGTMIVVLKMIFNSPKPTDTDWVSLADLAKGESAILSDFRLSCNVADHLMNLGFIPGTEVTATHSGPGGDPRIYRIERTEVALRRDVAERISVQLLPSKRAVPSALQDSVLVLSAVNDVSAD